MINKLKIALVAAAIATAGAAYAGPHHWGNWGGPDCPYAGRFADGDFGPHHRGFNGPRGPGMGMGADMGMGAGLESPYFANLIEQAGLKQDYQTVLRLKDEAFAKRQVLNAVTANSTDPAAIEKAANEFTEARRTLKEARWLLQDKLATKYPDGLPTPARQARMPK